MALKDVFFFTQHMAMIRMNDKVLPKTSIHCVKPGNSDPIFVKGNGRLTFELSKKSPLIT